MDYNEARPIIDSAEYWHYRFELPWRVTTPTKPGWAERVSKRRAHFFEPLLSLYGGTFEGKTVLDLACCQGYWSFESRKAGASSVIGIDSSPFFIKEAEAVRTVLGMDRCTFFQAHLEEDPWWERTGTADITLFLGSLYHLIDPIHVLRKAMKVTSKTIVLDGEVATGNQPAFYVRSRSPYEPTTYRSNVTSTIRTVPTVSAIASFLKDGGFATIKVLEPAEGMLKDYLEGTTASIIASR